MQLAFLIAMLVTLVVGASFWFQSQEIGTGIITTQVAIVEDLQGLQDLQRSVLDLVPGLLDLGFEDSVAKRLSLSVGKALLRVDGLVAAAERRLRQDKMAESSALTAKLRERATEAVNQGARVVSVYRDVRRELADLGRELDGGGARRPVLRNRIRAIVTLLAGLAEGRDRYLETWSRRVKRRHEILERNTLLAVAIGLLVCFLLLGFATPDVANPVKRFLVALREVREANFRARVAVETQHELADVAVAFNETLDGLEKLELMRAREFRREREKFAQLADMIDEAVVVLDSKGRIAHMTNRAFAFFSLSTEIIGRDLERVVLPDAIKHYLQNAHVRGVRAVHHKASVKPHPASENEVELFISTSIVQDAKGAPQITVLVFRPAGAPLNWPAPA